MARKDERRPPLRRHLNAWLKIDTEEKLRKLHPIIGSKASKLQAAFVASDRKEHERLDEVFDVLVRKKLDKGHAHKVLLPPTPHDSLIREYYLGEVIYPDKKYGEFGLREDDWIRHVLIAGMSRAGKTNAAFVMLDQLLRHQKPFMGKLAYDAVVITNIPGVKARCLYSLHRGCAMLILMLIDSRNFEEKEKELERTIENSLRIE